ncbi:ribokinase, partial [Tremellales sp. Uapishka_1]
MSTPCCLVRGSVNIDEFFYLPHIVRPGETISSTGFVRKAGGKGANQAYALARAGGAVHLDADIGADGTWIKSDLEMGGVRVERVRTVEHEATGRAIIQSSPDGENSIVLHAGANFHVSETNSTPILEGITHLLLQNEIPLPTTLAYLQAAGAANVVSVFNPSPMLSPEQLQSFAWRDLSWLIVNEVELQDLLAAFGSPTDDKNTSIKELAVSQLLTLHRSSYFSPQVSVICTLGAQGILYFQAPTSSPSTDPPIHHLPAEKLRNPLKDTTGAGDCFAGYFVAGLMESGAEELEQVLTTCLAACALCVENSGAMESIPSRDEVMSRL